jgi:cytoskeletal protein RodZ
VESLGNKLKTARENKGCNYDYVSRETNIAARYLEALEAEDFSVFPGEPYALGFLRNYGEYLGLDVGELLSLYRSLKIQEQPIPVEELLRRPSPLPKILAIIVTIIVVLGLAGGGFFLFSRIPKKAAAVEPVVRPAAEYTMNTDVLERRFYRGDTILVPLESSTYKLELSGLGDAVTVTTPGGPKILDLGQDVTVDLNNDGYPELQITAADFVKNDSVSGALLRFEFLQTQTLAGAVPLIESGAPLAVAAAGQPSTVIFTSPSAYPFTLQAAFQGYCLFRREILFERDRQGRAEDYFQRSDELSLQAQNGIRIGVSNAQAVKIQIIGGGRTVPLELGSAGEVVAADIRWVRDEENRYHLVLARLE